jgi:hypothetical protein
MRKIHETNAIYEVVTRSWNTFTKVMYNWLLEESHLWHTITNAQKSTISMRNNKRHNEAVSTKENQ